MSDPQPGGDRIHQLCLRLARTTRKNFTVIANFAACLFHFSILGAFASDLGKSAPSSNELTISDPRHVQDTTLRNGLYWGNWNFGNAQFLQVGAQPSTVYDTYRTISLIRFDLAGMPSLEVASAKLRLYVPRNLTQQSPVSIYVHQPSAANGQWREGSAEAEEENGACCWNQCRQGKKWAGKPGLGLAGVDYLTDPLGKQIAAGLKGEWLEFDLPPSLVQSWMDAPDNNAGLLLRTDDDSPLGQSTHICSSQHWSGNGPQLVVKGTVRSQKVRDSIFTKPNFNPRRQLPPMGPVYHRWLDESTARYAAWAKDPAIHLTGNQAVFPYLWDIIVRGEILMPRAFLPLSKITSELPEVIAAGDRARARQTMQDFMKYMMVFDYAREQTWYDSGPTADVLSPLQVARLFVKDEEGGKNGVRGIYSQYDDGRWKNPSQEELEKSISNQLHIIQERLKPTVAQMALIEPVIRQNMPQEFLHRRELKKNLDHVYALIAKNDDGEEMLRALRGMFFHHRLFLIHQSLFSMPKYSVLLENGDILGYAQWFHDVRAGQYSRARIGRQYASATRYMWRPSPYREAEYASLRDCDWSNDEPGFRGTGYVVFDDKPGASIDWNVSVKTAGTYRAGFRYSLAADLDKPMQLGVNGAMTPVLFARTPPQSWSTNSIGITLSAGENTLRLIAQGHSAPHVDYLDLQPIETADVSN